MIPADWTYKRFPHIWSKKLPVGWIVEGTSTIQCLCPNCEYGEGYNEPFIVGASIQTVRTCEKCGTEFIALAIGE